MKGPTAPADPPRRSGARRRRALLCALFAALTVLSWVGYERALPVFAGDGIGAELAAQGFPDAEFRVERITWRSVHLADVRLDAGFTVERVRIDVEPATLLGGQPTEITLRGVRWRVRTEAEALRDSAPVRLLRRAHAGGAGPADHGLARVRFVDGRVDLEGAVDTTLSVDGELRPREGHGALTVGSELGRHRVVVEAGDAGPRVTVHAQADPEEPRPLVAHIEPRADGAVALRVTGRLGAFDRAVSGHRLAARGAEIDGRAVLDGGALAELELRAAATRARVDGQALGDLALRGARQGEALALVARARRGGGASARLEAELPPDPAAWGARRRWPLRFAVEGPVDEALARRLLPEVALRGASVAASGESSLEWPEGGRPRWVVHRADLRAAAERAVTADAQLEDVTVALHGRAETDFERVRVDLEERSRLRVGRARLGPDVGALRFELTGGLRLEVDRDGLAARAPRELSARFGTLGLGPGDAIRLGPVAATARASHGRPVLTHAAGRTRLAGRLDARVARLRGQLRGRGGRLWGDVSVDFAGQEPSLGGRLQARVATLGQPTSEVVARDVRATLPLSGSGGAGPVRAPRFSWRGVPLGAAAGRLRLAFGELDLALRCRATDEATARLALSLRPEGGAVDLVVPPSEVRDDDPLQRAMAELSGLRVSGRAGGSLHVDLGTDTPSRARVAVTDATVEKVDGDSRALGVHVALDFASLNPLRTAGNAPVRFRELTLAGALTSGPGRARVRFDGVDRLAVEGLDLAWGGGRVRAAPFHFDPADPDLRLSLSVRALAVQKVLAALSDGRATGTGRLDGRLAFRLRLGADPLLVLGDSHLASRGGGRIRFDDRDLVEAMEDSLRDLDLSRWMERRIAATLSDFAYRRLHLTIRRRAGTTGLRAHVSGRGHTLSQELDLTVNVDAIQRLIDHSLRLLPSGELDDLQLRMEAK